MEITILHANLCNVVATDILRVVWFHRELNNPSRETCFVEKVNGDCCVYRKR